MPDDWIKMRVRMDRDPKVLAIANRLQASEEFQKWAIPERDMSVTSSVTVTALDVTVRVTVASLLIVWGVVREQAKADGEDMILDHCSLDTISRIAGVPGFGLAMAAVGWIEEMPSSSLRFPKCLGHMTSPEERKRFQAAERKRKQREREAELETERQRDMSRTSHADVTPREEKRRVEENRDPHPPSPPLPSGEGVCVTKNRNGEKSRYEFSTCQRYAYYLQKTKQGIREPGGYAKTIWRSGEDDEKIAEWLELEGKGVL